jgi:hypothetical protein
VGVESHEDAVRALTYLKNNLQVDPDIIVMDLSPRLIGAAVEVYGADKIALDPFHVMQCLNRAMVKDLARFRKQNISAEKNELDGLHSKLVAMQQHAMDKEFIKQQIDAIPIQSTSALVDICKKIIKRILSIYLVDRPRHFFERIYDYLPELINHSLLTIKGFGMSIADKIPKKVTTTKAMERMKIELLKKLKTLCRECQKPMKESQRQFNKTKWLVFKQPERLTLKQAEILTRFLRQYPQLNQYRDLTISIGSVYRLPIELVNPALIHDCPINPNWGDELHACLSTLIKYADAMFRFKTFFEKYPNAPKKCRANMEYQNVKFHQLFGVGNYMKGMNRIEREIQQHLGGVVRNFLC